MYRVCLVDDEIKNYQLFEKLVDWEKKGFEIAGTAADGLEALQKYEELHPDLIFMDIQLPMMDGLECVRCIREEDQEVQIVIVSAYGDFNYAQKAIRYGVQDFLLKPVSRLVLNQLVDKMKHVLDEKNKTGENRDYFHNSLSEQLAKEHRYLKKELVLPDDTKLYRIFSRNNRNKLQESTIRTILEVLPERKEIQGAFCSKDSCYLVVNEEWGQDLIENKLGKVLTDQGYSIEIYLWDASFKEQDEKMFWQCTSEFDNYGFYEEKLVCYKMGDTPFRDLELDIEGLDTQMMQALAKNDFVELSAFIEEIFQKARVSCVRPGILKNFVLDFLVKLKFMLKRLDAEETFLILRNVRTEQIFQVYQALELLDYVKGKLKEVADSVEPIDTLKQKKGNVILQANALAELYFSRQSFSVQEVADEIGISKNYFISIYKERTGTGFWEYVTKLRMDKAKEFLYMTEGTIAEIAQQTGYESEYYFSRKFKEYTGLSPKQFRRHRSI